MFPRGKDGFCKGLKIIYVTKKNKNKTIIESYFDKWRIWGLLFGTKTKIGWTWMLDVGFGT